MGFGDNLISLRKSKGYTRKAFAEKLSIPYKTLQNYETDQREPGHKLLIQMASILGSSIDELIGNYTVKNTQAISDKALQIAGAYDRADEPIQHIVDTALEPYMDVSAAKTPGAEELDDKDIDAEALALARQILEDKRAVEGSSVLRGDAGRRKEA